MVGMKITMVDPRRWISKGCPEHVDEVANIYVACEGINDRMEREVRDGLPMFSCTDDGSVGRRRGAGCDAALEARRCMDDVDMDSLPTQRLGFDSYVMIEDEMLMLGGNLSEERFSPTCLPGRPPSPKTFCDVSVGTVTSAVKAEEFLKGGVGGNFLQEVSLPQSPESCIILHVPA